MKSDNINCNIFSELDVMIVKKNEANYTNLIKDYYISDTRVKIVF
jgi:hypothetical protein